MNKREKVYLAYGIYEDKVPLTIGVFRRKQDAEAAAYTAENIKKYSWLDVKEFYLR